MRGRKSALVHPLAAAASAPRLAAYTALGDLASAPGGGRCSASRGCWLLPNAMKIANECCVTTPDPLESARWYIMCICFAVSVSPSDSHSCLNSARVQGPSVFVSCASCTTPFSSSLLPLTPRNFRCTPATSAGGWVPSRENDSSKSEQAKQCMDLEHFIH
jgi:hypothetical protein